MRTMQGMVESLNLSVAAGVVLAEAARQRGVSDHDFGMSEDQQAELVQRLVAQHAARASGRSAGGTGCDKASG